MSKHFVGTSREQFFYHNTLLCLIKALEGRNITIDLRQEATVCGDVQVVDGYMNISFGTAVYCNAKGDEFLYDNLLVQGRSIRYVHIPEDISPVQLMKTELSKSKLHHTSKKPEQMSRKAQRALKQHMETVASLKETGTAKLSFI